ncbi:hypothetical protein QN239_32055 [Mycolicibacterium sp. Y3]
MELVSRRNVGRAAAASGWAVVAGVVVVGVSIVGVFLFFLCWLFFGWSDDVTRVTEPRPAEGVRQLNAELVPAAAVPADFTPFKAWASETTWMEDYHNIEVAFTTTMAASDAYLARVQAGDLTRYSHAPSCPSAVPAPTSGSARPGSTETLDRPAPQEIGAGVQRWYANGVFDPCAEVDSWDIPPTMFTDPRAKTGKPINSVSGGGYGGIYRQHDRDKPDDPAAVKLVISFGVGSP